MTLELITKRPAKPRKAPALLFVHGAWHAAWCWDAHFLDYFAAAGFTAHALSLRGHGTSDGRGRLRFTRVRDYVSDVAIVADTLDQPPVLVGHSMGGFVVQKYLERRGVPGAVLMASIPPHGAFQTLWRMTCSRPFDVLKANLTLSLWPIVADAPRARKTLFSSAMPHDQVAMYHSRLQDESYVAFLDFLALDLVDPSRNRAPVLVLGANEDTLFSPVQVAATADAYGTTPQMFPGMAHDMMLEAGWRSVADTIIAWLIGGQVGQVPSAAAH